MQDRFMQRISQNIRQKNVGLHTILDRIYLNMPQENLQSLQADNSGNQLA